MTLLKSFLTQKLPKKGWNIVDEEWNVLWKHDGAWFFTIGQNRGLMLNHKAYVYKIDVKKNIVYVSKNKESVNLKAKKIVLENWHWIWEKYEIPLDVKAKIRYRQELQVAKLRVEGWKFLVEFTEEQWAIAPGQSVVAYIGDECVGGGVIC